MTVSDYESANKAYKGQWVQINQAHFSKDDGYNRLLIIISKGSLVNATTEDGDKIKRGWSLCYQQLCQASQYQGWRQAICHTLPG
ncbi:hypothetical protein [Streptococcus equi]|uniref:hypothetical protein n=1 Tax=Streptococcus equi TaxID=1336 RepID=UPI001E417554|nr:hypothetical protein [Streptococcus equi]